HRKSFALGIVFNLVALDLAHAKIVARRMREIEAGNGRRRGHGEVLGKADAGRLLRIEKLEQRGLFRVIWLRRITWRWPDTAIFLGDQFRGRKCLRFGIRPKFAPD